MAPPDEVNVLPRSTTGLASPAAAGAVVDVNAVVGGMEANGVRCSGARIPCQSIRFPVCSDTTYPYHQPHDGTNSWALLARGRSQSQCIEPLRPQPQHVPAATFQCPRQPYLQVPHLVVRPVRQCERGRELAGASSATQHQRWSTRHLVCSSRPASPVWPKGYALSKLSHCLEQLIIIYVSLCPAECTASWWWLPTSM
jgi:hypothetical protein